MKSSIITLMFAALVLSLTSADARAQQWQIIATFSGRPAGYVFESGPGLRDFDGDQVMDNVFRKPGGGGQVLDITSGADPSQSWTLSCAPFGPSEKFVGFYNFDGVINNDNPKEVLMARGPQRRDPFVIYNIKLSAGTCQVYNIEDGTVLFSVADVDKDGISEIVVADPKKNEIQIWAFR